MRQCVLVGKVALLLAAERLGGTPLENVLGDENDRLGGMCDQIAAEVGRRADVRGHQAYGRAEILVHHPFRCDHPLSDIARLVLDGIEQGGR